MIIFTRYATVNNDNISINLKQDRVKLKEQYIHDESKQHILYLTEHVIGWWEKTEDDIVTICQANSTIGNFVCLSKNDLIKILDKM